MPTEKKGTRTMRTMNETMSNNLKAIMTKAWYMVKTYGFTMSEALKQAWRVAKLHKAMVKGIVRFTFTKVSGEVRQAWGTLASERIPQHESVTGYTHPSCQKYYDMEKGAWRQFKIANLTSIG